MLAIFNQKVMSHRLKYDVIMITCKFYFNLYDNLMRPKKKMHIQPKYSHQKRSNTHTVSHT